MLFNDATAIHALVVAGVLQDLSVANISIISICYHAITSLVLSPFAHILQTMALFTALAVPSKGYCVIDKS